MNDLVDLGGTRAPHLITAYDGYAFYTGLAQCGNRSMQKRRSAKRRERLYARTYRSRKLSVDTAARSNDRTICHFERCFL
jgi:hypothetical protein